MYLAYFYGLGLWRFDKVLTSWVIFLAHPVHTVIHYYTVTVHDIVISTMKCQESNQGFHTSWTFLDFFLENSRTSKVLENHFYLEKS